MLDRVEGDARIGGIVHRQHDAGDDLDDQRGASKDAEVPEIVEVARNRIARTGGVVDKPRNRQLLVHPLHQRMLGFVALGPGKAHLISLLSRSSRSEEHTSELQSLMRNSYAVFGLKKQ